jgi:hypothetical protein
MLMLVLVMMMMKMMMTVNRRRIKQPLPRPTHKTHPLRASACNRKAGRTEKYEVEET